MFGRVLDWHIIYTFLGALARNGILAGAKFRGRRLYSDGGHHVGHRPTVYLWSPYVIGQTIIFLPCGFSLSSFFFPRLMSAVGNWMSTILTHMVWS